MLNHTAEMTSNGMAHLYTGMRSHVQDYRINRQRFLMQSAFNTAFQLQQTIDNVPGIPSYQKQRIDDLLTRFITTAEKIMTVDAAIKSKFKDFALQAKAVAPISTVLIELANTEVKQAHTRIDRANKTAITISDNRLQGWRENSV